MEEVLVEADELERRVAEWTMRGVLGADDAGEVVAGEEAARPRTGTDGFGVVLAGAVAGGGAGLSQESKKSSSVEAS